MFYKKHDNRLNRAILQGAILMSCIFFLSLVLALNTHHEKNNTGSVLRSPIKVKRGVCTTNPSVFTFNVVSKDKPFYWLQQNNEFYYKHRSYGVVNSKVVNGKLVLKCIENCYGRTVSKGLKSSAQTLPFNECSSNECITEQCSNSCDTVFVFIITPETQAIPVVAS